MARSGAWEGGRSLAWHAGRRRPAHACARPQPGEKEGRESVAETALCTRSPMQSVTMLYIVQYAAVTKHERNEIDPCGLRSPLSRELRLGGLARSLRERDDAAGIVPARATRRTADGELARRARRSHEAAARYGSHCTGENPQLN